MDVARWNWNDVNGLVSTRYAPWPFSVSEWIGNKAYHDLLELAPIASQEEEDAEQQFAERYFKLHPEMASLLPFLLDRGDPQGRELAFRLAKMAKTPKAIEALHDFAKSDRGPDKMRLEAAQTVLGADFIPADEPLKLSKKHFYVSEYSMFCKGQIYLAIHQDNLQSAQSWLQMWKNAAPDRPELPIIETAISEIT